MDGTAPLHEDHNPSFLVDANKNLFYYYGCGRGGGVIHFAELYHQVKFPQAVVLQQEFLRRNDIGANAFLPIRHTGMRIGECVDLSLERLRSKGPDQWRFTYRSARDRHGSAQTRHSLRKGRDWPVMPDDLTEAEDLPGS
jgi:hypothetical protein